MYHASKVEEIYREAQALKKLSHPSIVQLYNAFVWKQDVVLIMEYISGGELYQYVKTKNGLPELEARKLFLQLTDAVEYCHNKYIIHRDLKPTNILLSDATSQKIKIIDFGISGSNYGKDKSTAGSLAYMPPEVLTSSNTAADPAIDVWALGIILFFMLYGHLPFRGSTEKEVAKSITAAKVLFPIEKKKVTNECKKLVQGMLNKNPATRLKINEILQSDWLKIPDEKLIAIAEAPVKVASDKLKRVEEKKVHIGVFSPKSTKPLVTASKISIQALSPRIKYIPKQASSSFKTIISPPKLGTKKAPTLVKSTTIKLGPTRDMFKEKGGK